MELAPQSTVDRYTVEAKLGEGGLAVVYKVRHNRLGTLHAMKVLKVATQSIQERLLLEGRVQASLNHPNVVAVTDIIDVGTSPGLVMEFISGASLDELIVQERLGLDQIDALARGILEGVGAAHAAGLIHRDLKPANILLEIRGGRFIPKITDFGLAKMFAADGGSSSRTRTGMAMGTPSYMAPEQIESAKDVDARADVYSVGAILYELISGHRAYDDASMLRVFNAVVAGDRRPLASLRGDVPERWVRAVDAAMQIDRAQRPATCDALLELWSGQRALAPEADSQWDAGMVERARTRGAGSMPSQPSPPPGPQTFADPASSIEDERRAAPAAHVPAEPEAPPLARAPAATLPGPRAGLAVGAVMLLGGAGLALLAVLGLGALWWALPDDPIPAPVSAPVPAPVPGPAPDPTVPDPTAPDPTAPDPTAPDPTAAPDPAPTQPVVAPVPIPELSPSPRPDPASQAVRVGTSGDAERVTLIRQGRRYVLPTLVPPGTYQVQAQFSGEPPLDLVKSVTVRGDTKPTLHCDSSFYACELR